MSAPRGTCYLATSEAVAAAEITSPEFLESGEIPWETTNGWKVATIASLTIPGLASVSSPKVGPFGVTGELTTMDDYTVPQRWADAFDQAGFTGIFYTARFTPGGPNAIAWFRDSGPHAFEIASERDMADVCRDAGYKVAPRPPRDIDGWQEATPPKRTKH